jgi:protein involved in polysaccharide export with SLBB domain
MLNCLYRKFVRVVATAAGVAGLACLMGCQSANTTVITDTSPTSTNSIVPETPQSITLAEGDVIRISFPGAPNLDTVQVIRRDGKISLGANGDIRAAGMTASDLQQLLLDKMGPQLVVKEVLVSVQSSAFSVYVLGAVGHNGRMVADRRLTVLQAVIEAGLDLDRSNLKHITIIRIGNGHTHKYRLNLHRVFQGYPAPQFVLQPYDIIYVPQKFSWY